jgi:hypothetical protein
VQRAPPHSAVQLQIKPPAPSTRLAPPPLPPAPARLLLFPPPVDTTRPPIATRSARPSAAAEAVEAEGAEALTGMQCPPFSHGEGLSIASQTCDSQATPRQPASHWHENTGSTPCTAQHSTAQHSTGQTQRAHVQAAVRSSDEVYVCRRHHYYYY